MKPYPSIPDSSSAPKEYCYSFIKYDGSNLRSTWTPKRGFDKFGKRDGLLDDSYPILKKSIPLEKYSDSLSKIFKDNKLFRGAQSITVYFEFFGEGSFAGQHLEDTQYDVVLFDVNLDKKGFISPADFVKIFGEIGAELVYTGNLNASFINSVRNSEIDLVSKLPIKTRIPEGVVAKWGSGHKLGRCKIKTDAYREELKRVWADRWQQFWE